MRLRIGGCLPKVTGFLQVSLNYDVIKYPPTEHFHTRLRKGTLIAQFYRYTGVWGTHELGRLDIHTLMSQRTEDDIASFFRVNVRVARIPQTPGM